jgi:NAD(P)H-dependent FMN reductase
MTTVLGIVGSPRKNGRTNRLIDAALGGAAAAGAETIKVYLGDYDIRPFLGSGGSGEAFAAGPQALSELCGEADAIVLGAPVYWGDINGLTKDFMDTVRTPGENGKPALGTAIAGGSGKGLLSGVQSLYHFFYHRQMRAIDPTPVSRFNMAAALAGLEVSGARLVEMAADPRPFPGEPRDARWGAVLAHYATLPYLDRGPLDEFLMLAEQLIAVSEGEGVPEAQAELDRALALVGEGRLAEAAPHAFRAYQLLYYPARV